MITNLKLYHGGFGDYAEFVAAESEQQAIRKLEVKSGLAFLPLEVTEVTVDGFTIVLDDGIQPEKEPDKPQIEQQGVKPVVHEQHKPAGTGKQPAKQGAKRS